MSEWTDSYRPKRLGQARAVGVVGVAVAVGWWIVAYGSRRYPTWYGIAVCAAGSLAWLVLLYQLVDPRPLVRFNAKQVAFTGGGKAGWQSGVYDWSDITEITKLSNEYPNPYVEGRLNALPRGYTERAQRRAGSAFWVRTCDGRRYKISSGTADPDLALTYAAMKAAFQSPAT